MHARMHAHAHACTHMHVKHAKLAKHGCLHVGGHLQFLFMYKCACARTCVCVWGHPPMPPDAPHHLPPSPEPQGAQNTKIQ